MLSRLVDLFWSGVAALLIAAAALVVIVRLLLPEISAQRTQIENWISTTVGRPASVDTIEASWYGWSPRISVNGITFRDSAGSRELVRFDRAAIDIAPLASLLAGALRPRSLVVGGVELTLLRDREGRFSVAGMPPPKSPILKWLLQQDNFAVTDADLTIIDEGLGQSFALSALTATIRNIDGRKLIRGQIGLPRAIGQRLAFTLEADGDPLGDDWAGRLNFRFHGINRQYVLDQLRWAGTAATPVRFDIDGWSSWQAGTLEQVDFTLSPASLAAAGAGAAFSARGRISRRGDGWLLNLVDLSLGSGAPGARHAAASVAWRSRDGELEAVAGRAYNLPLGSLASALLLSGALPPAQHERLAAWRPSGALTLERGAWTANGGDARYRLEAELLHLSTEAAGRIPGVVGVDGALTLASNGGELRFSGDSVKLVADELLVDPLDVDGLDGTLYWRRADDGITLETARLAADIDGTALLLAGTLALPAADAPPHASLVLSMPRADAATFHHLVPRAVMPQRGENWVRNVLASGTLENGRVVLRGALDRFPFRDGDGVFAAAFDVVNADMVYSRRWPAATGVNGRVNIAGATVTMQVHSGRVRDATLRTALIEMPDLFTRERFVHVSGTADGPANSATDIVMNSPLQNGKAARLAAVDMQGRLVVDLDMNLGMYPGGPREVLGQARFDGNRISSKEMRIALEDFTGEVTFTRGEWYGEGVTARFHDMPVGLVMTGGLDDPNYDSEFRVTGTAGEAQLPALLERYARPVHAWLRDHQALDALSGTLPWKAVLTMPTKTAADAPRLPRRLRLESSLAGLGIDLPWPLGKPASESKPLSIDLALLDGVAVATRVDYGDSIDAELNASRGPDGRALIHRAEIVLGSIAPRFAGREDISVRGYLARLRFDDWLALFRRNSGGSGSQLARLPLAYDLQVSEFHTLGQRFEDLRLRGERTETAWRVEVSGAAVDGTLEVPRDLARGVVTAELERLYLAPPAGDDDASSERERLDPRRLPALALNAQAFHFGDIDLGSASIVTSRLDDGLSLDSLTFQADDFDLGASGDWLADGSAQTSHFSIDARSGSLATLLARFGYEAANIEGGRTDIGIDAYWPGTPADFRLAHMNGHFELHVADGRFLDIDPGGGRLFGLLSLQTLPRRLSLDFDDIFRKGFKFDSIDGTFEIENGNAYTNSLLMGGPAARIDVSGRTGLAEQDYDQRVVVTPALSSSIPMAGALFGPIGVGAGAVVYLGQKMFKSIPEQIDRIVRREYAITGSWRDPQIEKI